MFLFVGKHQCFKTDAGCYRLPVEATQQCGDVEENLARSKTQYFGLLTKGARWNRFSSNKCIVIFFYKCMVIDLATVHLVLSVL